MFFAGFALPNGATFKGSESDLLDHKLYILCNNFLVMAVSCVALITSMPFHNFMKWNAYWKVDKKFPDRMIAVI